MANNINYTVSNQMCTGCGVCEDICPKHCITIKRIEGEYRPVIDSKECLGDKCGRCLKVCPGVGTNLIRMSSETFVDEKINEDRYIGRYISLHTGYSMDEDIRYHSASGGMVSQFLIYLLEKRIINGAVVTAFSDEDHITPVSYIARNKADVLNARSSKYCPVSLNKVGNEICNSVGKYVIVGLPCHIQGFRKRARLDHKFSEKVVGYFSIYCSSGRTFNGQDYILKHYDVKKNDMSYFTYRDDGCLGYMIIRQNRKIIEGEKKKMFTIRNSEYQELKVPYTHYYGPMLRSFFKPHRCLTCIDHYGELADVCFGDIHIAPYNQDKIGVSSWITRTEYWEHLFKKAAEEGYIKMDELSEKILNASQATMLYPKRRKAAAVMAMDKILGRNVPQYDKPLDGASVKDFVAELVCHAQRFIGKHRSLWWIIELLNRGK